MPKYSAGVALTWIVAAHEAQESRSAYIEPEHFLAALTKVGIVSTVASKKRQRQAGVNLKEARREGQIVRKLFEQHEADPDAFRHSLRKLFPRSSPNSSTAETLHRSERSRQVFDAAAQLAQENAAGRLNCLHLMNALVRYFLDQDGGQNAVAELIRSQLGDPEKFLGSIRSQLEAGQADTVCLAELPDRLGTGGEKAARLIRGRLLARFLAQLTCGSQKSIFLVGLPGVGKKTLVITAAKMLAQESSGLASTTRLVALPGSTLAERSQGRNARGVFQQALHQMLCRPNLSAQDIVFLEVGDLLSVGKPATCQRVFQLLTKCVARGSWRVVLSATPDEFRWVCAHYPTLVALSRVLILPELGPRQTRRLLAHLVGDWKKKHGVKVKRRAIDFAIRLAEDYLPQEGLPGKAYRLLSGACRQVVAFPKNQKQASDLEGEAAGEKPGPVVSEREVAYYFAKQTGQNVGELLHRKRTPAERALTGLEEKLVARVVGHEEIIRAICRQLVVSFSELRERRGVAASFLLVGPPGVGKSHLAKTVGTVISPEDGGSYAVDLSGYRDEEAVNRLLGRPLTDPLWYTCRGIVTRWRQARRPVFLFDHVELAAPAVRTLLVKALTRGFWRRRDGAYVDLSDRIVFLTLTVPPADRQAGENPRVDWPEVRVEDLAAEYVPELREHVDHILWLGPLSAPALASVARLWTDRLAARFERRFGVPLRVGKDVLDWLAEQAVADGRGAWSLRRLVGEKILWPIASQSATKAFRTWPAVDVVLEADRVVCRPGKAAWQAASSSAANCCECGKPVQEQDKESWRWLGVLYLCPDCRKELNKSDFGKG